MASLEAVLASAPAGKLRPCETLSRVLKSLGTCISLLTLGTPPAPAPLWAQALARRCGLALQTPVPLLLPPGAPSSPVCAGRKKGPPLPRNNQKTLELWSTFQDNCALIEHPLHASLGPTGDTEVVTLHPGSQNVGKRDTPSDSQSPLPPSPARVAADCWQKEEAAAGSFLAAGLRSRGCQAGQGWQRRQRGRQGGAPLLIILLTCLFTGSSGRIGGCAFLFTVYSFNKYLFDYAPSPHYWFLF